MSKMKYQKEFEELASNNPDLLGGNTLAIQTEHYGVPLDTPEYASSYVRLTYNIFCKVKEQLEQELQKTREQLDVAEKVIGFYADIDSWEHLTTESIKYHKIELSDIGVGDFDDGYITDDDNVGGLRARRYFKDKQGE